MKERPLALLCLAVAVFLSLAGIAGSSDRDAALLAVQEYLTETAGDSNVLTFEGTVKEINAVSEGVRLSVNHIILYSKDKTVGSLSTDLKLILTIEEDNYLPGDTVRVTGTYYPFTRAGNPGQFDALGYYFSQNTAGRVTGAGVTLVSEGDFSLSRMLSRVRRTLRESYLRILEEKAARTVSAISLGEKSYMEQEWKTLYQEGGIAHIISISGLHISMIGMCIYRLLRRAGLSFAAASLPSAAAVALYALMSGFGVSAGRACIMFVLWLGAQIAGRKQDTVTAAGAAAVLILAGNGRAAGSASFLLSFGAILSIAILAPRLAAANPFRGGAERRGWKGNQAAAAKTDQSDRTAQRKKRAASVRLLLRRTAARFWDAAGGGLGIWIGTLPITLWYYYQCAPWSILVNLAVIPLMSALMGCALISCLAGLICIPAGIFLAAPVYYLLALFEWLCGVEQQLPGAVWIAGHPSLWRIGLYYAVLLGAGAVLKLFAERIRCRSVPALIWAAAIALCICLMGCHPRSGLTVTSLDVGQGDGALLQLPDGTNCLIDGGSTSVSSLWEYRIGQTIKYYGISTIDYVFLSHADSDHVSGIQEYLEEYLPGFAGSNAHGITLKHLVLPPTADAEDFADLIGRAEELGIPVLRMEAGQVQSSGSVSLICLAPASSALSGDKNEDSMVLLLQYGAFRMLFTGDLEGDSETALAASGADLSCDVLKVGHHGSKGASSETFLDAVSPSFGIISCGLDNSYGHPAEAAVERLRAAGILLYATMECGAVTVRSDGVGYTIGGWIGDFLYEGSSG